MNDPSSPPLLSIVVCTKGDFSEYWLEQLLKVRGDAEFILVYPPDKTARFTEDARVKYIVSPIKGELIQRFIGLSNASGKYVMALDDDDFVHQDIVELTTKYFNRFSDSWVLKLCAANIDFRSEVRIKKDWESIPDVSSLEICDGTRKDTSVYNHKGLIEVPIVPLRNKFNILIALGILRRKDQNGIHFENFNNTVWKNKLVQEALLDLPRAMHVLGPLILLPSWTLDNLLGLFIQAKYFRKNKKIGHWMPKPEQIRKVETPRSGRFYIAAELLLPKHFPQYGYFWNFLFDGLWVLPGRAVGKLFKMLKKGLRIRHWHFG